jgi:hypothetical protein
MLLGDLVEVVQVSLQSERECQSLHS